MVSSIGKYYELNKEELLKAFSFFGLFLAGIMEYFNSGKTIFDIFQDPFFIGAGIMSIASLFTFLYYNKNHIDYTYPAMFIFIATKLISQYYKFFELNLNGTSKKN